MDFILHFDKHLEAIIRDHGSATYLILFAIIFCETGLVVTPFLPGDSLLFAAGAFSARGQLSVGLLFLLLSLAAVLGNLTNYGLGKFLGPRLTRNPNSRIFKKETMERTHAFFERYGGGAIILTRFVPIIRTFAPFVAGLGAMTFGRFALYNLIGGLLWVGVCVFSGYGFGNVEFVKKHFEVVVVAIVLISILPMVFELLKARRRGNQEA